MSAPCYTQAEKSLATAVTEREDMHEELEAKSATLVETEVDLIHFNYDSF